MSKAFKVRPFQLSPEQKAEREAQARAERLDRRERLEDEAFKQGAISDGRILDAIGNWGNRRAMGEDGVLDRTAKRFFENPDANIGGLIAGAGERIQQHRTAHDQVAVPTEPIIDSPTLTLRMPK